MNNWHSVEKGEKAAAKEKSRRILGLLSSGEGRAFLAKGVAKMYGRQAAKIKRIGKVFSKVGCQVLHVINCDLTATAPHLLVSTIPRIRITVDRKSVV